MVKISYFLLIIIALAICHGSASQGVPPPTPPTGAATMAAALPRSAQEFLTAHNQARAEVGVGPLKWSQMLATAASLKVGYQRDKHNCSFADLSSYKYGSNQMWGGGIIAVRPRRAVEYWVEEKSFYNYAKNSCVADHECASYTQVVWKKSLELGCAQATCSKGRTLTICLYNPHGNIIGERPY